MKITPARKRSDLKTLFTAQSTERGRFARELQTVLMNFGKTEKKESGTVAGALHRAWIDTKVGLGAGDTSILESVEKGEDEARDAYREAIGSPLPPDVADVVSRRKNLRFFLLPRLLLITQVRANGFAA